MTFQKCCSVRLASPFIGKPHVSIGRFAKTEYDAREDVAVVLLCRLLTATGGEI
jgi:hypothetical protein